MLAAGEAARAGAESFTEQAVRRNLRADRAHHGRSDQLILVLFAVHGHSTRCSPQTAPHQRSESFQPERQGERMQTEPLPAERPPRTERSVPLRQRKFSLQASGRTASQFKRLPEGLSAHGASTTDEHPRAPVQQSALAISACGPYNHHSWSRQAAGRLTERRRSHPMETLESRVTLGKLIARSWNDETFKARLIESPREVLQESGIGLTAGTEVRVAEQSASSGKSGVVGQEGNVLVLTLPRPPADDSDAELADEQLEAVAGGICCCCGTCWEW